MGRFYHGDIEGKFWFGIQDSGDIENLITISPQVYYSWRVCNCVAEIDTSDYCNDCYESKEEHEASVIEEEGENDDGCLYYEEQSISYILDKMVFFDLC